MNDDLYIKYLEYGWKKKDGFTFPELVKDLQLSEEEADYMWNEFEGSDAVGSSERYRDKSKTVLYLSLEKKHRYLEYLQLKETQAEAKLAKTIAIVSVLVAIATSIISSYFSYKQINSPIEIKAQQFKYLTEYKCRNH